VVISGKPMHFCNNTAANPSLGELVCSGVSQSRFFVA